MFRRVLVRLIRRYQARGGGAAVFMVDCNFEPSCSEYAAEAIERFGAARGSWLAWRRIRRCTDRECTSRRFDPLPQREEHIVRGKSLS